MRKNKKFRKWYNNRHKRCFILKEGSADRFDSVIRINENGVVVMEYFLVTDSPDDWNRIKGPFMNILLNEFKVEKHIFVLEGVVKKTKEQRWIYDIQFYGKLKEMYVLPSEDEMNDITRRIESIVKCNCQEGSILYGDDEQEICD